MPARAGAVAMSALIVLSGCGSRGAPLPPVYPNPPAILGLTVAQRGPFAILRFPPPPLFTIVGDEDVELAGIEVLVYAERYPVLTAATFNAAIERRGEVMRIDAAAEAAAARARNERLAIERQAAAEGREPPPLDPDAPATTVRRRGADEDAIHRVPPAVLADWRAQGLAEDAVLAAARQLVNAVDVLWRELGLPSTVIDPGEPVLLPDAGRIAAASEALVERAGYERPLPVNSFLGRAATSQELSVESFDEQTVNDMLQVTVPVGTPSTGTLRTRYFFAVRGVSTRDTPGLVTEVVPLAPAPVPVPPTEPEATVSANGVELSWQPPAGDVALRRLDPDTLLYNVYRMLPGEIAESTPLHLRPLTEPMYIDRNVRWGETYVYEVRALTGADLVPPRESEGVRTGEIEVIDVYPPAPASELLVTRAGGTLVQLQWTPSPTIDIVGYRVYRHPYPAPPVPLRFDPGAEEGTPAANAPSASAPPPGTPPAEDAPPDPLVAAGWRLITPEPVPFSRANDPDADPTQRYVYAVEAIDAAGNLSALAIGVEPGDRP